MPSTRRVFLRSAAGGFFAFAARHQQDALFAAQSGETARAKRCIVLWMNGGPSQLDTFDPKPGTSTGGDFGATATSVSGIQISETLPRIAQHMDKLAIVRNLTSAEGEHARGQYYLHTGYRFVPGFPRPALGSMVAHESPSQEIPSYVSIGSTGFGPAYLGPEHAPFAIENPREALELMRRIRKRRHRLELIGRLGESFDARHARDALNQRRAMVARIESLVATPFVEALDVDREPERRRQRYGDSEVGRRCLLARRLLEAGVRFVEVQQDGWDTHADNFRRTRDLCGELDQPWSVLLDDLAASGLLSETIVVWMGEFGRTPNINAQRGRDHFPRVTPVVLAGGGIQGGQVVGKTNRTGSDIEGESFTVPDLFATLLQGLGIDPNTTFTTSFDSPAAATDGGRVIEPLFS